MDLINSVQAQQFSTRLSEGQINKWKNTGLLDGLNGYKQLTVARLLENQAIEFKQKLQSINEASEVSDIKGFQNIAFPMVRRVFAGLLANDIVGVQPMSLPNGLIYYLDFKYGTVKAGNKDEDFEVGASVYGDYNGPDQMGGLSLEGTGGFYDLNTSYSQREIVSGNITFTTGSVTAADIGYDPEYESEVASMLKVTATDLWTAATAGTAEPFNVYSADLTALKHWALVSGSSTDTAPGVPGTPVRLDPELLPIHSRCDRDELDPRNDQHQLAIRDPDQRLEQRLCRDPPRGLPEHGQRHLERQQHHVRSIDHRSGRHRCEVEPLLACELHSRLECGFLHQRLDEQGDALQPLHELERLLRPLVVWDELMAGYWNGRRHRGDQSNSSEELLPGARRWRRWWRWRISCAYELPAQPNLLLLLPQSLRFFHERFDKPRGRPYPLGRN